MKRSMIVLLILILAISIGYPNQGYTKEERIKMSFAAGSAAGVFYFCVAGMSKIVEKYTNIRLTVESTGSSAENVRLVGTKAAEFGLCSADIAYFGYNGIKGFEAGAFKNLRSLFGGPNTFGHFLVRADSPIETIYDWKGKKISVSAVGTNTALVALDLLGLYGIDEKNFTKRYFGPVNVADAFKDKSIDGAMMNIGIPASTFVELTRVVKMRFLSMEKDKIEKWIKIYPMFESGVIPAGTYAGQDKDVQTYAVKNITITHKDVPDDVVYQVTKSILEHNSELAVVHPQAGLYRLENALYAGKVLPLHPGAERYLKEKGLLK
jgi:TRAP transporter TAXI family solute receptor